MRLTLGVVIGAAVITVIAAAMLRDPIGPAGESLPPPERPLAVAERPYIVQLLPRDAIRPIYHPEFLPASSARLEPDALVLGVRVRTSARAYPIDILTFREIVNDTLDGIPILVTW